MRHMAHGIQRFAKHGVSRHRLIAVHGSSPPIGVSLQGLRYRTKKAIRLRLFSRGVGAGRSSLLSMRRGRARFQMQGSEILQYFFQLIEINRLKQIFIASRRLCDTAVGGTIMSGNDHDWNISFKRLAPDMSRDVKSVYRRQLQIEQHEIG